MTQPGKAERSFHCFSWGVWSPSFTFVPIPVLNLGCVDYDTVKKGLCGDPTGTLRVHGFWKCRVCLLQRFSLWCRNIENILCVFLKCEVFLKLSSMSTPAFLLGVQGHREYPVCVFLKYEVFLKVSSMSTLMISLGYRNFNLCRNIHSFSTLWVEKNNHCEAS